MNRGSHHRWCSGKKGVLINLRKRCNLIALCNPIFKGFVTLCIPKPIVICNPALSYFAIFKTIGLCHPSFSYFVISIFYRCVYQKSSQTSEIFFYKQQLFTSTWQIGKHSLNSLNRLTLVYIAINNFLVSR